jgi:hypothetical protein
MEPEKWLPSGKHTKNYGKSQLLMGQPTISVAIFNSYVTNYQRVFPKTWSMI